jgi:CRP/FNR family transcriptional regulator
MEKYGEKTDRGIKINLKLTHQELADMVGTAREMVSRTLVSFKKNNCIDIDDHYIYITNVKELKEMIY